MFKILKALLGKDPGDGTAKAPVPNAPVKPAMGVRDYRAVSVAPGLKCCSAAAEIVGKSYLTREAPRLPLANCTLPTNCSCKFKKAPDRRDGERREFGPSETGRWFAGPEHRKRAGRRSAKD